MCGKPGDSRPGASKNALRSSASECDSTWKDAVCYGSALETPCPGSPRGPSHRRPLPGADQNSTPAQGKRVFSVNHAVRFRHVPLSVLGAGGPSPNPTSQMPTRERPDPASAPSRERQACRVDPRASEPRRFPPFAAHTERAPRPTAAVRLESCLERVRQRLKEEGCGNPRSPRSFSKEGNTNSS